MSRGASRTAVLVCQGRAAADGRTGFSEPIAMGLLRADERTVVEQVRANDPPAGWGPRAGFELVRACAEMMVPRTAGIDDAIRAHLVGQLVMLGAGLDARAWRMTELRVVDVIEVDHPASQADKRDRVGELQPVAKSLRYQPVDFTRDRLDDALEAAGHRAGEPTTWVWEGVVPYLTRAEVDATMRVIAQRSAPGSGLVVNYQAPSLRSALGRLLARVVAAMGRHQSPTAGEPWRSLWTPTRMRDLLGRHGFTVESDADLLSLADRMSLTRRPSSSLRTGRVAVAVRAR